MKQKLKKVMVICLAICLASSMLTTSIVEAKAKTKANKATWAKKSYSVNGGKSVSLKVKKAPKGAKFKWSITKGSKNLKLVKKSTKATASFQGIKKGTATVRCVVTAKGFKKKTLNIKVTVKTNPPKKPVPTKTPVLTQTPIPTKTPVPTQTPIPTKPPVSYAALQIQESSTDVETPYGDEKPDGTYNTTMCTLKTFTFTGNNLPKHSSQMKAEYLKDPALVTAITVAALHRYTENDKDAVAILDFLAGPAGPISAYKQQHFLMQLKTRGFSYIPFSYFNGATVANGYKPSAPYSITIHETPYTDLFGYTKLEGNKGYYEYYCKSDGVDSLTRKVRVRQAANGNYYLIDEYLLAEIKAPAASSPW